MRDDEMFLLIYPGFTYPVVAAYFCLCVFPRWEHTPKIVHSSILLYSVMYVLLLLQKMLAGHVWSSELPSSVALFSNKDILLAGWAHHLAFDLLVSNFIVNDAFSSAVPHIVAIWTVPLTHIVGPAGYVAYAITKYMWLRFVGPRQPLLFNQMDALAFELGSSFVAKPVLTVLYGCVTLLGGYMFFWIVILPSSW